MSHPTRIEKTLSNRSVQSLIWSANYSIRAAASGLTMLQPQCPFLHDASGERRLPCAFHEKPARRVVAGIPLSHLDADTHADGAARWSHRKKRCQGDPRAPHGAKKIILTPLPGLVMLSSEHSRS